MLFQAVRPELMKGRDWAVETPCFGDGSLVYGGICCTCDTMFTLEDGKELWSWV